MTESDQITLYSCHLCGFCETSLSALTKHTASHIKNEQTGDHFRATENAAYELMDKGGENMADIDTPEDFDSSGNKHFYR